MSEVTPSAADGPDTSDALRSEARLALHAGAILLGLGLVLAVALSARALVAPSAEAVWAPLTVSAGPLLLGWAAWRYAAFRIEQAERVEAGRALAPPRLRLQALARWARQAGRRSVLTLRAAAAAALDQALDGLAMILPRWRPWPRFRS